MAKGCYAVRDLQLTDIRAGNEITADLLQRGRKRDLLKKTQNGGLLPMDNDEKMNGENESN